MKINTNAVHNLINIAVALVPALHAFDWTQFFDADTSLKIVGTLGLAKIFINVLRDGPAGLVKYQPPVQ